VDRYFGLTKIAGGMASLGLAVWGFWQYRSGNTPFAWGLLLLGIVASLFWFLKTDDKNERDAIIDEEIEKIAKEGGGIILS